MESNIMRKLELASEAASRQQALAAVSHLIEAGKVVTADKLVITSRPAGAEPPARRLQGGWQRRPAAQALS